jgi:hypothetical protein
MPRKTNQNDIDIEDSYRLESDEEINNFVETYTISGVYDRYSPSDYDYDVDNYGYADDYDR